MEKDFYNIDQRWLASYFEKEWFDHLISQNGDQSFATQFPKFPSHHLYCEYHEEFVVFLAQSLKQANLHPTDLLEIGASLGRTFYEICTNIKSVKRAIIVEPSENLHHSFKKIFLEKGPVKFPVLYGYKGESEVDFSTKAIQEACSHVEVTQLNMTYENIKDLHEHDLIVCSHVIDQCKDPKALVEFLKKHTSKSGVLALSCSYQWKKGFVDFEESFISNISDLFGDEWKRLGETEIEYRVRGNERHWITFMSHMVVFEKD